MNFLWSNRAKGCRNTYNADLMYPVSITTNILFTQNPSFNPLKRFFLNRTCLKYKHWEAYGEEVNFYLLFVSNQ